MDIRFKLDIALKFYCNYIIDYESMWNTRQTYRDGQDNVQRQ